ncbi:hypothetical protein AB3M89_04585 [Microbacterium sp. 179-I 3D2 NHS]|uniref:hypothetical protein n=1 Tax=Microbacterium sp. 179-I 3D2 NHS TaxID=3235178 RepID=UPI0039A152A3
MAFEKFDGPRVERREATPTLGIRIVTPFRGMLATRDDRVRPGEMPPGEYAVLAYRGSSLQANRMLLAWPETIGRRFDAEPDTGVWGGRFEILRTDPRHERRKTAWTIELAFLLEEA